MKFLILTAMHLTLKMEEMVVKLAGDANQDQ
jgi:hypothetical protein